LVGHESLQLNENKTLTSLPEEKFRAIEKPAGDEAGTESAPHKFSQYGYRGIEYAVVEGIGRYTWRWSAFIGGAVLTGQAHSKQAAMVSAEKAIDRTLAKNPPA
jgi:hypothetical protein